MRIGKLLIIPGLFILLWSSCTQEEAQILEIPSQVQVEERQDYWGDFEFMEPCEAESLTFFISEECMETDYGTAIFDGIEEYNNLEGSSINFTQVNSESEADLVFDCLPADDINALSDQDDDSDPIESICGSARANSPFEKGVFANVNTIGTKGQIGSHIRFAVNWERCPCKDVTTEECPGFSETSLDCMCDKKNRHA